MTLYRSVAVEQAIGLLVLAAVAVLGTTHPIP
jgi:putative copper export protein